MKLWYIYKVNNNRIYSFKLRNNEIIFYNYKNLKLKIDWIIMLILKSNKGLKKIIFYFKEKINKHLIIKF